MKFKIYTDGSCWPNPDGVGGWAYKVMSKESSYSDSGGENFTTNNRMELMAIIMALESLPDNSNVEVHSDSKYCVNSVNHWIYGWVDKNFEDVKNADLMKRIYGLLLNHKVKAFWVKGHNGHSDNEEVDKMAEEARLAFEEEEIERLTNINVL